MRAEGREQVDAGLTTAPSAGKIYMSPLLHAVSAPFFEMSRFSHDFIADVITRFQPRTSARRGSAHVGRSISRAPS